MSRSNTNYYNICLGPIGEDGYCAWHQGWSRGRKCIPENTIETRRGLWQRKPRFPKGYGWKRHCQGPNRCVKRSWQRKVRRIINDELRRTGEVETDCAKLLAGWYGWWS